MRLLLPHTYDTTTFVNAYCHESAWVHAIPLVRPEPPGHHIYPLACFASVTNNGVRFALCGGDREERDHDRRVRIAADEEHRELPNRLVIHGIPTRCATLNEEQLSSKHSS